MENYTCTKRRMTKEEQVIAENNYRILNYYIYKKNLKPIGEWLERLSVPYVVAIMKYTDCADLQRYSIRTIIFYALDSARANYYRKINCGKRKPKEG